MNNNYGRTTVELRHYLGEKITADLALFLLDANLYDNNYGAESNGLRGGYSRIVEDGQEAFKHLWVLYCDGIGVGVAALERREDPILHVYVRPLYRRRGYAKRLLVKALAVIGTAFGLYTPSAGRLYASLGIIEASWERSRRG